jgi:twitching motility protein PilT
MAMMHVSLGPIEAYLQALWDKGGSDLLLTAYNRPLVRVDGQLNPIEGEPVLDQDHVDHLVLSVLTEELKQELRTNKEVDFSFAWKGQARFRANCFFQMGTLAMSLRIIPLKLPTLEQLGLPPAIEYFSNLPQGLVLVTGPTGSGKSTTLAAMINYINENRRNHILTIEDPVEYVHPHKNCAVSQREVGYDTLSFARALRAAMREDPDVILVGEMRDPETVQFALSIAETGHLVFATLHTNDAPQALDRISDMFPAERQNQIKVQLAACLSGVVSQRLIPRVGGGMVAAFEILVANNAVRGLIREGKTHQVRNILASGRNEGMCTLESWLNMLVQNGFITYEDAVARSMHAKEIKPPVQVPAGAGANGR